MAERGGAVGIAVLVGGLALLALGTMRAVRQDAVPAALPDSLRARLAAAETKAGSIPSRFEVAYVQLDLDQYTRMAGDSAGFRVVPTEVAARIAAGGTELHPDFGAQAHDGTGSSLAFARAFRERRVAPGAISVVGLLLSRVTPGDPPSLSLDVRRIHYRGFRQIFDPGEAIPDSLGGFGGREVDGAADVASTDTARVTWSSDSTGVRQFVPLYLMHSFSLPPRPENQAELDAGESWWQVMSGTVLEPRRFTVRGADGQERPIPLSPVLSDPLVLSEVGPAASNRSAPR